MDYKKAITCIVSFKNDFKNLDIPLEKKKKVPNKLVSEIGELYVLSELTDRFENVVPYGGQAKYDIMVGTHRIEVKTSLLKNDGLYDRRIRFWGWTVMRSNQKHDRKFDFLVGVSLKEDWGVHGYYVLNYDEAVTNNSVVSIRRYPSIKKKMHIFQNDLDLHIAEKYSPGEVTDLDKRLTQNCQEFLNRWDKINMA